MRQVGKITINKLELEEPCTATIWINDISWTAISFLDNNIPRRITAPSRSVDITLKQTRGTAKHEATRPAMFYHRLNKFKKIKLTNDAAVPIERVLLTTVTDGSRREKSLAADSMVVGSRYWCVKPEPSFSAIRQV